MEVLCTIWLTNITNITSYIFLDNFALFRKYKTIVKFWKIKIKLEGPYICFCMEHFAACFHIFCKSNCFLFDFCFQLLAALHQKAFDYQAAKHPASGPKSKQNKSHGIQVPSPSGWWCGGARPHRGFPSGLECEPPTHWLCHPHEGLPQARMFGRYQRSWQPRNSRPRSCQQCCPLQLSTCSNQKEEAFSWSQLVVLQASQFVFCMVEFHPCNVVFAFGIFNHNQMQGKGCVLMCRKSSRLYMAFMKPRHSNQHHLLWSQHHVLSNHFQHSLI